MVTPIDVLRANAGVLERPANSNRVRFRDGVDLWEWWKPGTPAGPWCALAVSYAFAVAGTPLQITTTKGFVYVPYAVNWAKSRGFWRTKPAAGLIVAYEFTGDHIEDHTGIVELVQSDGIFAWEGNTSSGAGGSQADGGGVFRRFRVARVIAGYIEPPAGPIPKTTIPAATWGPVTEDNVQPIVMHTPTDNAGNGYNDIPGLNKARVVSIVPNAANPPQGGYKPIPRFGALQIDGGTRIVIEGAQPGGGLDYTVWVTAA